MIKYYKATVKLGHMGVKNHTDTVIFIKANNIIQAEIKARKFPGVKHSKVDAITNLQEISKTEYEEEIRNGYNAYGKFKQREKNM